MQDYLGLADGAGTGLFKLDSLNLAAQPVCRRQKIGVYNFIALYRQVD
jgi:hypothetical protein